MDFVNEDSKDCLSTGLLHFVEASIEDVDLFALKRIEELQSLFVFFQGIPLDFCRFSSRVNADCIDSLIFCTRTIVWEMLQSH